MAVTILQGAGDQESSMDSVTELKPFALHFAEDVFSLKLPLSMAPSVPIITPTHPSNDGGSDHVNDD